MDRQLTQMQGGVGKIAIYRTAGTVTNDLNASYAYTATVNGVKWRLVYRGVATANVMHTGAHEYISGIKAKGSYVWYRNGTRNNSGDLDLNTTPSRYTCDGNTLRFYYSNGTEEYTRLVP